MARLDPQHYRNVLPPSMVPPLGVGSTTAAAASDTSLVYPLSPAGGKHGLNLARLVPGPHGSILPSQRNEYAVVPIPEYRGVGGIGGIGGVGNGKIDIAIERVAAPPTSTFTSALSAQLRAAAVVAPSVTATSSGADGSTATKRASIIATAAAIAAAPPATSIAPPAAMIVQPSHHHGHSNSITNGDIMPNHSTTITRSASGSVSGHSHKRSMSLIANFSPHLAPNLSIFTGMLFHIMFVFC
jgi:hypothetical protein